MIPQLPSALDNLAANNVIDFDADAYLKGVTPRYVGSPKTNYLPLEAPLPNMPYQPAGTVPPMPQQPATDVFGAPRGTKEEKVGSHSSWKKTATALFAGTLATVFLIKNRTKIKPATKQVSTVVKTASSKLWASMKSNGNTFYTWIKNKIK